MIFYWPGEDHDRPSGGVRTHYDHVRQLRTLGLEASILHLTRPFRCTWFDHAVPIAYAPEVAFGANDVLVVNEILGPATVDLVPGVRKVIFAQNAHYTFRGWPVPPESPAPQTHPDIVATLVLTDYEREMFAWAFPDHPCYVVKHGIDATKYRPGAKQQQIAYMPRKHADEAQQVFGWLHAKGALDGWRVVAIDGQHETEVARILGESAVFFAFGYPEGGTLPPFEACLAGCAVVGYGGFASDAYLEACGGWTVPSGDSCGFARLAADVLETPLAELAAQGLENRDLARECFSVAQEQRALELAWTEILAA